MNGCFKIFVLGLLTFSVLAFSSAQEAPKDPAPKQSPLTKVDETPPTDKTPVDDDENQTKPKPADNTSVEQPPAPDAIDVDGLLRQLESIIRDPFAPDAAIIREQKKANNEFVEIQQNVNIPEITLVGYIEQTIDEKTTHLAGIKLDNRVYFVRESDRLTITRNSGNIVIEITSINDGFVEVKLGTLAESLIIR
jgi:hypothetical protein